jgi:hypothetical protein
MVSSFASFCQIRKYKNNTRGITAVTFTFAKLQIIRERVSDGFMYQPLADSRRITEESLLITISFLIDSDSDIRHSLFIF